MTGDVGVAGPEWSVNKVYISGGYAGGFASDAQDYGSVNKVDNVNKVDMQLVIVGSSRGAAWEETVLLV